MGMSNEVPAVALYRSIDQRHGKVPVSVIQAGLTHYQVAGQDCLDWYLEDTSRVPATWHGCRVCFWGTKCPSSEGESILCLEEENGVWRKGELTVHPDLHLDIKFPAVVLCGR